MTSATYQRVLAHRKAAATWLALELAGDQGKTTQRFKGLRALIRSGYNDSGALQNLAYMFDVGDGVKPSRKMAFHFYRKSFRRGSASAATNWAIELEMEGRLSTAQRWYERAVQAGDSYGRMRLAKLLLRQKKDYDVIKRLLQAAVDAGPETTCALQEDGTWKNVDDDDFLEAQRLVQELV